MSCYTSPSGQGLQLIGAVAVPQPLSTKPKPPSNAFYLEATAILAKLKELHAVVAPGLPGDLVTSKPNATVKPLTRPKNDPLYDIYDMLNSLIVKVPVLVGEMNKEIFDRMYDHNVAQIDRIAFLLKLKPADLSAIGIDMAAVQSKGQEIIDYKTANGYAKTIEKYSYKDLFETLQNLDFGATKELKQKEPTASGQKWIRIPPQLIL